MLVSSCSPETAVCPDTDSGTVDVDSGIDAGTDADMPECSSDAACDDDDECTNDVCDRGVCEHPSTGASCDDGNPCTHGDRCVEGGCAGIVYGCSAASACAETTLPQQIGTATGCVPSFSSSGANCNVPNGCGTGAVGCPFRSHASTATATHLASTVPGQPGTIRLSITLDSAIATYNYNDQCLFHAQIAIGSSVVVTMDMVFEATDVCGGPLRYVSNATATTSGNVDVSSTPINGTSPITCALYASAVDQPTRRSITDTAVAEYLERVGVVCATCPGCASGIRCEP